MQSESKFNLIYNNVDLNDAHALKNEFNLQNNNNIINNNNNFV